MTATSKRHKTMAALVRGSRHFAMLTDFSAVADELDELGRCSRVHPERRKRLLQVLHSTRALDTALGAMIIRNGKLDPPHSIGPRLSWLASSPVSSDGHIPQSAASSFKMKIGNKRNLYAHQANKYPGSSLEVDALVADIHACLVVVLL